MKLKTVALLFATLGCSLLDREGPDVTCADLENGAINACDAGIIASCRDGQVTYEVCRMKSACDRSWQEEGAYRCNESDSVPVLNNEGGSGGSSTGGASVSAGSDPGGEDTATGATSGSGGRETGGVTGGGTSGSGGSGTGGSGGPATGGTSGGAAAGGSSGTGGSPAGGSGGTTTGGFASGGEPTGGTSGTGGSPTGGSGGTSTGGSSGSGGVLTGGSGAGGSPTGGSSGATTGGSSGSGGVPTGGSGGTTTGGNSGTGGSGTGGGGGCAVGEFCLLADPPGTNSLRAIKSNGTVVVFTDCLSLWTVPAAGGPTVKLDEATGSYPCQNAPNIEFTEDDAVLWYRNDELTWIALDGSSTRTLATSGYLSGFTVIGDQVYYFQNTTLYKVALAGGSAEAIATGLSLYNSSLLKVSASKLVWIEEENFVVADATAIALRTYVSIGSSVTDWDVSGSLAVVTSPAAGREVATFDLVTGAATPIVGTDSSSYYNDVVIAGGVLYVVNVPSSSNRDQVLGLPTAGGTSALITVPETTGFSAYYPAIEADDTRVYLSQLDKLYYSIQE